jgi:peroxiredoxin
MKRISLVLAAVLLLTDSSFAAEKDRPVIDTKVADFTLSDFRGREWQLRDFDDHKVVVVAFLGVECPLVKLYSGRLAEIAAEFAEQGVAFIGINSNQQDSLAEIANLARTHNINFPLLKDPGNRVADQFGAKRTPEIFVLDQERIVRYHGRIDDQFTYGIQRPKVERNYLHEALSALIADKEVEIAETETVGCLIGRILKPEPHSDVTYSKQISRILQDHCVECHRSGEIAPFSLTSYDEAVGWAEMIAEVVDEQRMPPWHANPKHGEFVNDTRLTDQEKRLINDWVASGAPEGDPSELPEPREFVAGWRIGKPDMVIHMSEKPFRVPATGAVKYQYFTVDPGFKEDKWIKAAECRPGNREVVHHIIVATASRDRLASRIHGDLESDWLTATAPGARPLILPDGMAKRVPAGARLIFQMHYTPNGTAQEDRSSVGLIFADPKTVKREIVTQKAATHRFAIPPGADNHRVAAGYTFKQDSLLLALFPHMHLRGKSFRYTITYPDRREEVLLDVPRYDFNWQNSYEYAEPKLIPAGTMLKCVAHFDNSENNLANPDPSALVRWGDQTWEEMMIGYFDMAIADQDLSKSPRRTRTAQFVAALAAGKVQIDKLSRNAEQVFESDKTLRQFGEELRKLVPQLDRIDWMTVEDDTLHVRRVAQSVESQRGGSGIKVSTTGLRLAEYIAGQEVVVHRSTDEVKAPDFQLLSRLFASSLHIPVRIDDQPGIINYWSTELDAFPPQAVEVLEAVARSLADQ